MIKIRYKQRGAHVHMSVFVGPHTGALGKAGELTMREDEFADLRSMLQTNDRFIFEEDTDARRATE